jgi:hypothetical protein
MLARLPASIPAPAAPSTAAPRRPGSPPAQQQVHGPAASDVRPRPWQVFQDVRVGAAGVFEGVGQDGYAVQGPPVVDGLGELGDGAAIPGQPGGVERGRRAGGAAEDVPQQVRLRLPLLRVDVTGSRPGREPGAPVGTVDEALDYLRELERSNGGTARAGSAG